jgi:hypothetical protein
MLQNGMYRKPRRIAEAWSALSVWPYGRPARSRDARMTPLHLSDTEMTLLMSLAQPIEQHRRPQFLQEVAAELEVKRQAGEIGEGAVHRVARSIQRRFFDPPALGEAAQGPRQAAG